MKDLRQGRFWGQWDGAGDGTVRWRERDEWVKFKARLEARCCRQDCPIAMGSELGLSAFLALVTFSSRKRSGEAVADASC